MEAQDAPLAKVRLAVAISVVLALTLASAVFAIGLRPQVASAPKKLVKYVGPDKSFACVLPEGWKREERSAGATGCSIRAESGGARVSISSDLAGSLMADIARSGDAQSQNFGSLVPGASGATGGGPRAPVEKLHDAFTETMENKWNEFEDQPMKQVPVQLGDCRVSEWSGVKADVVGAGKTRGLRATVLSGERRVVVLCYCSADDWQKMVPVFSKIIRSLGPGGG